MDIKENKQETKKVVKWYTMDSGSKIFYNEKGINRINDEVAKGSKIIHLTNEHLDLKHYTHTYSPVNKVITHNQSGKSFQLNFMSMNQATFVLDHQLFSLPASEITRINSGKKNEDKAISLAVYEIDIDKMNQKNMFSGYPRTLYKEETDVIDEFSGVVSTNYNMKTN